MTNGSPITGYKFFIRESDGVTYTEENVECDGSTESVITLRQCHVALTTLRASPYELVKDDPVSVKVTSINVYGESVASLAG